jgi:hypothetical protein
MKKTYSSVLSALVIMFISCTSVFAQGQTSGGTETGTWTEMESFRSLFNETLSAAQDGNFGPVKKGAEDLTRLSILMAKSNLPEANDNTEFRTLIGNFTDQCEQFQNLVLTGKSDSEIMENFTKLNSNFEEILKLRQEQLAPKE